MLHITSDFYAAVARQLFDRLGDEGLFNGTVAFVYGSCDCLLRCTLILYRTADEAPEGAFGRLCDVVPVWWEFHTSLDGEERLNDFSFNDFKAYLL